MTINNKFDSVSLRDEFECNKLYRMLQLIKEYGLKICIDKIDRIYITIDKIGELEKSCNKCDSPDQDFSIEGTITDFTETRAKIKNLRYYCTVKAYAYHDCNDRGEYDYFSTLKLNAMCSNGYIWWDRCITTSDLIPQIISKQHIIINKSNNHY